MLRVAVVIASVNEETSSEARACKAASLSEAFEECIQLIWRTIISARNSFLARLRGDGGEICRHGGRRREGTARANAVTCRIIVTSHNAVSLASSESYSPLYLAQI